MLRYATGVDLITNAVKAALGMPVDVEQRDYNGHWAEVILHSDRAGAFDSLWVADEIRENVVEEDLWVRPDDTVGAFSAANEAIGTLILRFDTPERLAEVMGAMDEYVKVIVK